MKNNQLIIKSGFLFLFFVAGLGLSFVYNSFFHSENVVADVLSLDEQAATIKVIKENLPSVVSIAVYEDADFYTIDSPSGEPEVQSIKQLKSNGSGLIISTDGYIVTNRHVLNSVNEDLGEYIVILNSGEEYDARLVGKDPFKDLAVLKIEAKNLRAVKIGNSDNIEIGTTVVAIGNSLGRYQNSVTKGIISGLERDLNAGSEELSNVIQTDAEINLGNSGGPLINLNGDVIGVNVAKDALGNSIGFSIPVNDVRPIVDSIIKYGRIVRPILGVKYVQTSKKEAEINDLPRQDGAWIRSVIENSPARKAGILPDDIVFEVNAIKIDSQNTLASIIQKYKPGDKIGMKIQRGDKVIIRVVELGEYNQ